ncbi:hypothetical protein [Amycolatopsis sp. H20-H5]|uniref:hypothetical protein n=1 Tax=Amycolatopsis sp. H20-H5 TaxID=3046309 RepID=UPI002DBE1FC1|nr:hypothetical protein [Amycolatopsis sp. H20-H5]MEC3976479.1 hypothetical protein [Amycolatopsis sp. H20-H5]
MAEPEVVEAPAEDVAEDVASSATAFEASPEAAETVDALTGEPEPVSLVKPSPRRKIRDTGIRKPVDVDEVPEPAARADRGERNQFVLAGVLVLVGLLLAGAAVIFKVHADDDSASTNNTALLDVAKTAQVKDQVSKATEALFSYDFTNIKKTEDAAKDLLVNEEVRNKYNLLIGQVRTFAPQQKLVVTCKVTRSAVVLLNGDRAKVMVFIDQTSTRTDTKKTTAGSAQLHLNAQLQGDRWKITDMDTYNVPAAPAPAAPAPSK